MGHYTQEDIPPGREEFWRENAVALIEERNETIGRLRARITLLERQVGDTKRHAHELRGIVESLADRVARQAELLEDRARK